MIARVFNRSMVRLFQFLRSGYWRIIYSDFRYRYSIAPDFRFNGQGILLYGGGDIVLGSCSYIGEHSKIQSVEGCVVRIGAGCSISSNVRVFTETSLADSDFRIRPVPSKRGDVVVGDACWIGANVLINPGVSIGENSIVGANSVVTRDVPENEIWGGVPAKLIRKKN